VDILTHLPLTAGADLHFTEVGVIEWHIQAVVPHPLADRAAGIARQIVRTVFAGPIGR
jgi:hypothetical protein